MFKNKYYYIFKINIIFDLFFRNRTKNDGNINYIKLFLTKCKDYRLKG